MLPTELLAGKTILVVEDQALIGLEIEALLTEAGAAGVMLAADLLAAERAADGAPLPDAAVLDIRVGSANIADVARRLEAHRLPLVFTSGLGDPLSVPQELRDWPFLRKPFTGVELLAALAEAFAVAARRTG